MKTLKQISVLFFALAALTACDKLEYHPYDLRFDGARHVNVQNAARIEADLAGRDSVTFAFISDTQRWYDETADAVRSINAREDVDFVLHGGDLTDFGVTSEFVWMRDELEKLRVPYVTLIGNHDHLGNGLAVFHEMFGSENFSFNAGDTHFACFNTNTLEQLSNNCPDFSFLAADIAGVPAGVRRTIVAVHAVPESDQFYGETAAQFHEGIKAYPGLQFGVCGHLHARAEKQPYDDGFIYYQIGAAKSREYYVFHLTKEGGMTHEVVQY